MSNETELSTENEETAIVADKSRKEEIFLHLEDLVKNSNNEEFQQMSTKSVRDHLAVKFGDEVHQYKTDIKSAISQLLAEQQSEQDDVHPGMEDNEGVKIDEDDDPEKNDDDEEEDDDTDEEEDYVEDNPDFAALPDDWKAQYEDVVWVKTNKSFPWWPSFIYNPIGLSKKLRMLALRNIGKKHVVYYYGSKEYACATPKQMRPFSPESVEELGTQKMSKKYATTFAEGLELAKKEIELPKADRAMWNHVRKVRKKKVVKPAAAVKSKPKAATETMSKRNATQKTKGKKAKEKKTAEKKVKKKKNPEDEKTPPAVEEKMNEEPKPESEVEEESEQDDDTEAEFSPGEEDEADDQEDEDYEEENFKPKKTKRKASSDGGDDKKSKKRRRSDSGDKRESTKEDREESVKKKAKKKKKSEPSDEEKDSRKKMKKEKAPPKPKPEPKPIDKSDHTMTAAQKKKRIEEKNALERNRINQMKHSSEPVWKQNLAKSGGANVMTSSQENKKPSQSASSASSPRPEETKLQRAVRLSKLIDIRIKAEEGKSSADFETAGIIKVMRKARNLDLSLSEWTQSTIIELISSLRKHSNAEIAAEAKEIRSHLKVKVAAAAAASTD